MSSNDRPVLVAFDGSAESEAAVRTAVALFRGCRLIVVTVWEPGLAAAMTSAAGVALRSPSGAMAASVSRGERDHVATMARAGAELAQQLGAVAEPIAVTDHADVAGAIASEADRHEVCAVAIGSRGLGRVRAPLLGSTSQALLRRTGRPVLVVRAPT